MRNEVLKPSLSEAQRLSVRMKVAGSCNEIIEARNNAAGSQWHDVALVKLITTLVNEPGAMEALKELQGFDNKNP